MNIYFNSNGNSNQNQNESSNENEFSNENESFRMKMRVFKWKKMLILQEANNMHIKMATIDLIHLKIIEFVY